MTYLLTFTLLITLKGVTTYSTASSSSSSASSASSAPAPAAAHQQQHQHQQTSGPDCGTRSIRRQPRTGTSNHQYHHHNPQPKQKQQQQLNNNDHFFYNARIPKIIAGSPTKEGQFPWQASLELLHPSMGFLGHWCGGVLIDEYWILSAAHCVHNDLFNLPLPPLWTIVLGEYDRNIESGYEQRIPVEKIVLHQSYHNFLHDLVLMKLSVPADLTKNSNIRKICLPFLYDEIEQQQSNSMESEKVPANNFGFGDELNDLYPFDDNFLRFVQGRNKNNFTLPSMKDLLTTKITNRLRKTKQRKRAGRNTKQNLFNINSMNQQKRFRRRNDKFMQGFDLNNDYIQPKHGNHEFIHQQHSNNHKSYHKNDEYRDLPYIDCVATGWGKSNVTGDLTDILLKTDVPLHSSSRCKDAYGEFVNIHKGHLCAGKLNGKGGTCVGDSGGPLQCRLTKNGPWILAGITSFGSGCALEGFPDVYTRTSFYLKWIHETINSE